MTATSVIWADHTYDKKFNAPYPVFISTPNGETVESVTFENTIIDLDDQSEYKRASVEALSIDQLPPRPVVIVKDFFEDMNRGRTGRLIDWETSNAKFDLVDADGGEYGVNIRDFVTCMSVNDSHRTFSSFVLFSRSVQNKVPGLSKLTIHIEMSNGDQHDVEMGYQTLKTAKATLHKNSLYTLLGSIYPMMVNGETTDQEIIDRVQELGDEFERQYPRPTRKSGNMTKRRRRVRADESDGSDSGDSGEQGVQEHGDSSLDLSVPKRQMVRYDCIHPGRVVSGISETVFYMVITADPMSMLYVSDFTTTPPLPCDMQYSRNMPTSMYNSTDLYKDETFAAIMSQADRWALSHSNVILWFTISDVDVLEVLDTQFVLNATIRSTLDETIYGQAAATGVLFQTDPHTVSNYHTITSLFNYSRGEHLHDVNALTPAHVNAVDFKTFENVGYDPHGFQVDDIFNPHSNNDEAAIASDAPPPPIQRFTSIDLGDLDFDTAHEPLDFDPLVAQDAPPTRQDLDPSVAQDLDFDDFDLDV